MLKKNKLLYLHGFSGSPQSHKAQQLLAVMRQQGCDDLLVIPQIPVVPADAASMLKQLAESILTDYNLSVAGSSLGGYYATWLAEQYDCTAVLINPAIEPYKTLEAHLGENKFYYSEQTWEFKPVHIDQLRQMDVTEISHPENFLVLLQTGDEVLDYHQAARKFSQAECVIEPGGNHAFNGFENHIKRLLNFSHIICPAP